MPTEMQCNQTWKVRCI